jgi:L-seryl-tRNA(Ser) seleniumtransferase
LNTDAATALVERFGRAATAAGVRAILTESRAALKAGAPAVPTAEDIAKLTGARLDDVHRPRLGPVFNLTGTVLHTNLGRAVLAASAIEAAAVAMRDPVALEYDLTTGKRGERDDHIQDMLCDLTGAEAATVVNNNAAAVLLALSTFASGREAIVSRGELIEIGGAFRMPDVMARAGALLIEVGTTNRTHPRDYRDAITARTGVIMKVHTSNYRIEGFTAEVGALELAGIAAAAGVPVLNDLGSGTLVDLSRYGLKREPTVREAVAQGADLVTFSGDKLLGGPQAGFIVGRRDLIAEINRNPMKRALRVDKIRLAAIEATLKLYRDPDRVADQLPTLRFLSRTRSDIMVVAQRLVPRLSELLPAIFVAVVCECDSQIGSGALPVDTIPSAGIAIRSTVGGGSLEQLSKDFRQLSRPVIGRIDDNRIVLDLRCLDDEEGLLSSFSGLNVRISD